MEFQWRLPSKKRRKLQLLYKDFAAYPLFVFWKPFFSFYLLKMTTALTQMSQNTWRNHARQSSNGKKYSAMKGADEPADPFTAIQTLYNILGMMYKVCDRLKRVGF